MAQHGYLREYSEGWEWDGDRDRDWHEREGEGDRGFMLGFRDSTDDRYRRWRQKQMEALDRDYEEYCRERAQQFHQDFSAWRQQRRHGNPQPLQPGMTQSGQELDPTGILELKSDTAVGGVDETDPMATATLGTTSSGR